MDLEPHLPSTAVASSFFAKSGFRIRATAGEVGGVAETMAQTAARQGRARARSRHVRALCGSKRCGSERSGEMARVNQYLCPYARARGADRAAAAASTAVADSFLSN